MEIEKEKQVAGSLQRKLDSAYEANGTKYIIKKMQGYLNALQQLITSSEESSVSLMSLEKFVQLYQN